MAMGSTRFYTNSFYFVVIVDDFFHGFYVYTQDSGMNRFELLLLKWRLRDSNSHFQNFKFCDSAVGLSRQPPNTSLPYRRETLCFYFNTLLNFFK